MDREQERYINKHLYLHIPGKDFAQVNIRIDAYRSLYLHTHVP